MLPTDLTLVLIPFVGAIALKDSICYFAVELRLALNLAEGHISPGVAQSTESNLWLQTVSRCLVRQSLT